jgi:hypothetical protein
MKIGRERIWRGNGERGGMIYNTVEVLRELSPDKRLICLNLGGEKKAPWSESASELYRPSDRRMSAK